MDAYSRRMVGYAKGDTMDTGAAGGCIDSGKRPLSHGAPRGHDPPLRPRLAVVERSLLGATAHFGDAPVDGHHRRLVRQRHGRVAHGVAHKEAGVVAAPSPPAPRHELEIFDWIHWYNTT